MKGAKMESTNCIAVYDSWVDETERMRKKLEKKEKKLRILEENSGMNERIEKLEKEIWKLKNKLKKDDRWLG